MFLDENCSKVPTFSLKIFGDSRSWHFRPIMSFEVYLLFTSSFLNLFSASCVSPNQISLIWNIFLAPWKLNPNQTKNFFSCFLSISCLRFVFSPKRVPELQDLSRIWNISWYCHTLYFIPYFGDYPLLLSQFSILELLLQISC